MKLTDFFLRIKVNSAPEKNPIKIKDGLFVGSHLVAKIDFITNNKVTHIINTVPNDIPNLYQRYNVQYLSIHLPQDELQTFDSLLQKISIITDFIESSIEKGSSCLIHSYNGRTKACSVAIAYLMNKYFWTLSKSFQFVKSKHNNLFINSNYIKHLENLEKKISKQALLVSNWKSIQNQEDLLLTNTFFNSRKIEYSSHFHQKKWPKKRLVWKDSCESDNPQIQTSPIFRINSLQTRQLKRSIKSILKEPSNNWFRFVEIAEQKKALQKQNFTDSLQNQSVSIGQIQNCKIEISINSTLFQKKEAKVDEISTNTSNSKFKDIKDRKRTHALIPIYQRLVEKFNKPYRPESSLQKAHKNQDRSNDQKFKRINTEEERPLSAEKPGLSSKYINLQNSTKYKNKINNLFAKTQKPRYPSNLKQVSLKWK